MQLGRFTIEQLSEGQFELFSDGKINRAPVPEADKQGFFAGINPFYITDGSQHILLDAGLGWGLDAGSSYKDVSNICTNLNIFGVTPGQITHIILSHLHYDHAAGISYTDEHSTTRPTFPNAKCYIQQTEWDFAVQQVQADSSSPFYHLDDLYRLYADSFFEIVTAEEKEIIPGITIIRTGGHTPGHQVVRIQDAGQTAYYLGDLVSSPKQLNYFDGAAPDSNRVQAKKTKISLLKKACQKGAFILFYHSVHSKIGQLDRDEDQNYVVKDI